MWKVDVETMSNDKCTDGTQYDPEVITCHMIYASEPDKDSCQGDSGGPMKWAFITVSTFSFDNKCWWTWNINNNFCDWKTNS